MARNENYDYDVRLLCTIVRKSETIKIINLITKEFSVDRKKIFCLRGVENELGNEIFNDDYNWILTYNVINEDDNYSGYPYPLDTITKRVHRKKETNTIYTIDALNLISEAEYGEEKDYDPTIKYPIKWNDYSDCILFKRNDQLIKINTQLETVFTV